MRIENIYGTRKRGETFTLPTAAFGTFSDEENGGETTYVTFGAFEATASAEASVIEAESADLEAKAEDRAYAARRVQATEEHMLEEVTLPKHELGVRRAGLKNLKGVHAAAGEKLHELHGAIFGAGQDQPGLLQKLERAQKRKDHKKVQAIRAKLEQKEAEAARLCGVIFQMAMGEPAFMTKRQQVMMREFSPLGVISFEIGTLRAKEARGYRGAQKKIAVLRQKEEAIIAWVLQKRNGAPTFLVELPAYQAWCDRADKAESRIRATEAKETRKAQQAEKAQIALISDRKTSPTQVREALTGETRLGVLIAAAKRTDLTDETYKVLMGTGHRAVRGIISRRRNAGRRR